MIERSMERFDLYPAKLMGETTAQNWHKQAPYSLNE
jgi:hypothetical protein